MGFYFTAAYAATPFYFKFLSALVAAAVARVRVCRNTDRNLRDCFTSVIFEGFIFLPNEIQNQNTMTKPKYNALNY